MEMGLKELITLNDDLRYSPFNSENYYVYCCDKQYGEWLHVWNELTQCSGKKSGYELMVGKSVKGTTGSGVVDAKTLYIPLQFWFK
jgi:hypothetical protein